MPATRFGEVEVPGTTSMLDEGNAPVQYNFGTRAISDRLYLQANGSTKGTIPCNKTSNQSDVRSLISASTANPNAIASHNISPAGCNGVSGRRIAGYPGPVSNKQVPGGVVHKLPADMREALIANSTALAAWKDITPLARNEFICWVEDAKQEMTRQRRIRRTQEELEEGQRRPCCWPGCRHRERTGR
jgi:bacteriocin resistance YdeI/OmpD-like protein